MSQFVALEAIVVITSVIGLIATILFVADQINRVGCNGLFDTKMVSIFILLGFIVSTTPIFDAVRIAINYEELDYTFARIKAMRSLSTIFFMIGAQCHVSLLYIRTDKILIPLKFVKPIQIVIGIFVIFSWLNIAADIAWDYNPTAVDLLYWATGMIAAFSYVSLDITFNAFFTKFVWESSQVLHKDSNSITLIIARSGLAITAVNLIGFGMYIGILLLEGNFDKQVWLIEMLRVMLVLCAILWMRLKWKLDRITPKNTRVASKVSIGGETNGKERGKSSRNVSRQPSNVDLEDQPRSPSNS
jgi:hypothetical protein